MIRPRATPWSQIGFLAPYTSLPFPTPFFWKEVKINSFDSDNKLGSKNQYDNDHPNHSDLPNRECNPICKNLVWAMALV
jgi:hypothetical protein